HPVPAARPHGGDGTPGILGGREDRDRLPPPHPEADGGARRADAGADRVHARRPGALDPHYTREAGVRSLEREIATLCRKQARQIAEGHTEKLTVTPDNIANFLGVVKFRLETELVERTRKPGVAVGLAWTPTGGDVLFVEANSMKGGKHFTMTGHVGQVMQESMQAALAWVRSHAADYDVDPEFFQSKDIHMHVPAGAIPKDGPSAGVTMVVTLVSALTRR